MDKAPEYCKERGGSQSRRLAWSSSSNHRPLDLDRRVVLDDDDEDDDANAMFVALLSLENLNGSFGRILGERERDGKRRSHSRCRQQTRKRYQQQQKIYNITTTTTSERQEGNNFEHPIFLARV